MPIYIPTPESAIRKHVENMLLHRGDLIAAFTALAEEMPRSQSRRQLRRLVEQLEKNVSASVLMSDPATAIWLTHASAAMAEPSKAKRLTSALAYANAVSDSRIQSRHVLLYPAIAISLAFIVFVVICFTIVPTFEKMYNEFGLQLPAPTLFLMWCSRTMTESPIVSLLVVIAVVLAIYAMYRLWTQFALATRLFGRFAEGNSASVAAMARFTNQLAELLDMGASLPESIWFAGQSCGNRHLRNLAVGLANHANQGTTPLNQSFVASRLPANLIYALSTSGPDKTGSTSKPNTALLRSLSAIYRERVRNRVDWAGGITSPLATLGVAFVVAVVVFSLYLPIFSLITGLS
ncbi:type II secretion system F family protein [Novipirellula sp. SH528]|uniref:type II secretion system F family protein n=1 Tax=Novipirellula sp. SH528 TaxID=3454466 RepID=UPI003F9ECAB9